MLAGAVSRAGAVVDFPARTNGIGGDYLFVSLGVVGEFVAHCVLDSIVLSAVSLPQVWHQNSSAASPSKDWSPSVHSAQRSQAGHRYAVTSVEMSRAMSS